MKMKYNGKQLVDDEEETEIGSSVWNFSVYSPEHNVCLLYDK